MSGDRFNDGKMRLDLMLPDWIELIHETISEGTDPAFKMGASLNGVMTTTPGMLPNAVKYSIKAVCQSLAANGCCTNDVVDGVCTVLANGADKYSAYNWAKGLKFAGIMASANRHWYAREIMQEPADPESGLDHRFHILANLFFIRHFIHTGQKDLNDLLGSIVELHHAESS